MAKTSAILLVAAAGGLVLASCAPDTPPTTYQEPAPVMESSKGGYVATDEPKGGYIAEAPAPEPAGPSPFVVTSPYHVGLRDKHNP